MLSENYKRLIEIINLSKRAFGKYRIQIITLITLGFFSGILEGVGVNAIIPLFSFISGGDGSGSDIISQFIKNSFLYFNVDFNLNFLLIFIVCLFILKSVVLVIGSYIKIKITADYENDLRNDLFKKTINAKWAYLLKQKLGYLDTVLSMDVRQGSLLLDHISSIIIITTSLIIYTFIALSISTQMTILALACGFFIFVIFSPLLYKTKTSSRELADVNKEVAHHINENILGMKTVKVLVSGERVIEIAEGLFYILKKLKIQLRLLRVLITSFLQPISVIFVSILFAFSYKTPSFSLAALVALIYLIQRIFQYIQQLQGTLQQMTEAAPYLKDVLSCSEKAEKNMEENVGENIFQFNDSLKFQNIGFFYGNQKIILSDISFVVKKGEMIGLIGPSGSGKTTIFDIILRLFDPTSGNITLDGVDISKIDINNWRHSIGYVSQDMFLINGTMGDNIKFYDNSISDEDVREAAKKADIYSFINGCSNGFSTVVGERGILLSVGQRQRIILARILARRPKLLLLDEATSALDSESESKVQNVINSLKGKLTIIVIAHRLSTVIKSDKLLVLENGRIIEEGSPADLLKDNKSYFYKSYNIA